MADITQAMGPAGKVALGEECKTAKAKVEAFQGEAKGIVQQVEGVINGLRSDYSGEGAEVFYTACASNIQQINAMIDNICKAYAGDEGLFLSIHNQMLESAESLNKTLASTNQRFNATSE
jgi:uncharacterized protein YukE